MLVYSIIISMAVAISLVNATPAIPSAVNGSVFIPIEEVFNSTNGVQARAVDNKSGDHCCDNWRHDWSYARSSQFDAAINILMQPGTTYCPARYCLAPNGCHNGAQLLVCNDNYYPITPTSSYLASYAQDIKNLCERDRFGQSGYYEVCGQEFDSDNYNIVLRGC